MWTVSVSTEIPEGAPAPRETEIDHLMETLPNPAVVNSATSIGASFTVDATTARSAITEGLRAWSNAARHGLNIVRVEVMTEAELNADVERPPIPDLVGVAEVAEILEVSKQRVSQLAHDERFPPPVIELKAGPVWVRGHVEAYLERWDRTPGRPKAADYKVVSSAGVTIIEGKAGRGAQTTIIGSKKGKKKSKA